MSRKGPRFEIVKGETVHISFSGKRARKPTVFLRVGGVSVSKRAFQLGLILALCQILDGILTYVGLSLMGVHMEGNKLLAAMMYAYGMAPAIFIIKILALILVGALTLYAHNRLWVRRLIVVVIVIYLTLAVIPWTYLISERQARLVPNSWMYSDKE